MRGGDPSVHSVIELCRMQLCTLILSQPTLTMPDVLAMLAAAGGSCSRGCTTPNKLHWWGRGIGDDGCGTLASILANETSRRPPLENLLLGGNLLGDACLASLSAAAARGRLRSLRALGLSRNRITDYGCEMLAAQLAHGNLPSLHDLFLSKNVVSDRCAAALGSAIGLTPGACSGVASCGGAAQLERLGLNDNNISDGGLMRLLAALSGNHTVGLRELSLSGNEQLCRRDDDLQAAIRRLGSAPSLQARLSTPLKISVSTGRCRRRGLSNLSRARDEAGWETSRWHRPVVRVST